MGTVDHLSDVTSSLSEWAATPFTMDMDLVHWGLFTGLVIVLTIMWLLVLKDLRGAI